MKHEGVIELFHQAVDRFSGNTAIDRGHARLTYGELESRANSLANLLISSGASRGSIVAILTPDAVEAITAIIAVLKAGGVFVPLDPRMPEERLKSMVAEVSPRWIVAGSQVVALANTISSASLTRTDILALSEGARSHGRPSVSAEPDDLCYVFFTSGSTGRPKGIAGRLKGVDHFIRWEIDTFSIGEGTRVSHLTSISFDAVMRDIFVPLCAGGVVCVPDSRELILDPKRLLDWMDTQRINLVHCVPSVFRSIAGQELDPNRLSCLKHILMAGEPLHASDVRRWMDVYGDRVQLVNLYGPSETTMTKLFYIVSSEDRDRESIPIGKPMEGAVALVVDGQGRPCPPGVVGEIYIRTPHRTLGYLNRPDLTDEVFIRNPFGNDPDDIVYKTGDYGRVLEDGNFVFLGRKDHQVKIRGVRVELAEIESILQQREGVKEAVVLDCEDPNGNKYLCAYVVLGDGLTPAHLREFLATRLPDYMLPSKIITMAALPRTISGKIDRRALPKPEHAINDRDRQASEPLTLVEKEVARIWSEVLGINNIGVRDNFFELGGHSLMAFQIISRLSDAFGVDLPMRTFFETLTVYDQALAVTKTMLEQEGDEEMAKMIADVTSLPADTLNRVLNEELNSNTPGENII